MFYKKKPVLVEAIEWDGIDQDAIRAFIPNSSYYFRSSGDLIIHAIDCSLRANIGDMIVSDDGKYYSLSPDEFCKAFDLVKQEQE